MLPKWTQKPSQDSPKSQDAPKPPGGLRQDPAKTPPRRAQDTPRGTQGVPRPPKTTPSWVQNPIQNQCKNWLKINTRKNQAFLGKSLQIRSKSLLKWFPNPLENACKNKQVETNRKITKLIYFVTSLLLRNLRFTGVKRTFEKFIRNATHVKHTPTKTTKSYEKNN